MIQQEWRRVAEFPGYMVSQYGAVRGPVGEVLHPYFTKKYAAVKFKVNGKYYSRGLAKVIAQAWIGPVANTHIIKFKNGKPLCFATNLAIVPRGVRWREFMRKGEDAPGAELISDQVAFILTSSRTGVEMAKKYGRAESTISAIRRSKTWRNDFPKGFKPQHLGTLEKLGREPDGKYKRGRNGRRK